MTVGGRRYPVKNEGQRCPTFCIPILPSHFLLASPISMSVARRSRRTAGQSPARLGQGDGFGTAPANDWSSNSATTPASEGDAGAADSSDEDMDSRSQLDKLRAIRAAVGLPFLLVIGTVCESERAR